VLVRQLLLDHSSVVIFRDDPTSGLAVLGRRNSWKKLDADGRRLQSRVLSDYRRFSSVVRTLLRQQPQSAIEAFEEADKIVIEAIEQSGRTGMDTVDEALGKVEQAMDAQLELMGHLYSAEETPIAVPDVNALLRNPDLEEWSFDGWRRFTILLLPSVVEALDRLKVTYRVEEVRRKAEALIGRIKSYRSRGDLLEGVTLRRDVSTIKATAREPRFEESLPWLDPTNEDDRIIASFIEAMREHPRSPIVLVTTDLNLQNKAAFARLPFSEPPPSAKA
jgi:PIN domain